MVNRTCILPRITLMLAPVALMLAPVAPTLAPVNLMLALVAATLTLMELKMDGKYGWARMHLQVPCRVNNNDTKQQLTVWFLLPFNRYRTSKKQEERNIRTTRTESRWQGITRLHGKKQWGVTVCRGRKEERYSMNYLQQERMKEA